MDQAAAAARKTHGKRGGKGAEKFVNSERLRVLGKHLHEDIKRFRDPGETRASPKINRDKEENVEQVLPSTFFKLKGQ